MSFRIPSTSPDFNAEGAGAINNFDNAFAVQYAPAATYAITTKEGTVSLQFAGVVAATLPTPVAGLPSAGGDDGRELSIYDTTGHAHTVTSAANIINGNKHIATFGGTVASFATFVAIGGVWYLAASNGVTLT